MFQLSKKGRVLKEKKPLSKTKQVFQKDTYTHNFTTALSLQQPRHKTTYPLINEWIKSWEYICKYNGLLFSHKTRKFYHDNMDGHEGLMVGKVNQTEKNKYFMISLIYGIKTKQQ